MRFLLIAICVAACLKSVNGQNCKAERLKKLQGTWLKAEAKDTTLLKIKEDNWRYDSKYSSSWDLPYKIQFADALPQFSESQGSCRFILLPMGDTLFKEIIELTDSTLILMHYPHQIKESFKKPKGLPPGFSLATPLFGTWWDEETQIVLKPDSSFSVSYSGKNGEYYTCGKFTFDGDKILTLKDALDKNCIIYHRNPNPDSLVSTAIKDPEQNSKNQYILFDQNHEIHLHYNWMGLWLRETHIILVQMGKRR